MIRLLYRRFRDLVLHDLISASSRDIFADGRDGIEIVGFFNSPTGLGEAARLCARQLADAGYKIRCTSVERFFLKPHEMTWRFENTASASRIGCRIFHLNPPMMPPVILLMGKNVFKNAYNIGCWAWELEQIPREWVKAISYMNAILCPSEFTSTAIRRQTAKPVITVPHPVQTGSYDANIRRDLGIAEDVFLVSSIFSFGSALERKNPQASIRAFTQAFGHQNDVCLILKSNAGGETTAKKKIINQINGFNNIRLLDNMWSREQTLGLLKTSDVYLSLHRSEGFGLPVAEAMCLGTPAVATNWSGNTDFCTSENSYLIDYKMVPVRSRHPEFKALHTLYWADPDESHAATVLKTIYENRSEARAKAQRCLDDTNHYFSTNSYGRALETLKA